MVRDVLRAYAAAYDARDLGALRRVFPSLPGEQASAIGRTFAEARSYRMMLSVLDLEVNGAVATATCEVTHELVPRIGVPSTNVLQSRFTLRQGDGGWVIERVDRSGAR
jgi:hypothetical protein